MAEEIMRVKKKDLIATANAIREKGKTTEPITFSDGSGFADAVNAIEVALPYTPIDFLETDGSNYIDTGFKPNPTTTKIECVMSASDVSKSSNIFGVRYTQDKSKTCTIDIINGKFRAGWIGDYTSFNFNVILNKFYKITCLNNRVDIDNEHLIGSRIKYNGYLPSTFLIGAQHSNDSLNISLIPSKYKYFKIWDNGVLVRDLVPCVSNNLYGMWDKVENKFYSLIPDKQIPTEIINVKSYTFTSEGEVFYTQEKAYIRIVGINDYTDYYDTYPEVIIDGDKGNIYRYTGTSTGKRYTQLCLLDGYFDKNYITTYGAGSTVPNTIYTQGSFTVKSVKATKMGGLPRITIYYYEVD